PMHRTHGARLMSARIIEADLTWTGSSFEPDIRIAVDADGRISSVGAGNAGDAVGAGDAVDHPGGAVDGPDGVAEPTTLRLPGQAILPGFIDVHSHAFQRGLRGRGETFPPRAPDTPGNFWSWREAMYRL